MHGLLEAFYGEMKGELPSVEQDADCVPQKPTLVEWPCPSRGQGCAVLIERGQLVVACRTCLDSVS